MHFASYTQSLIMSQTKLSFFHERLKCLHYISEIWFAVLFRVNKSSREYFKSIADIVRRKIENGVYPMNVLLRDIVQI